MKHPTSNQIALVALGLSVLGAAASVYQWWNSGKKELISTAIELSDRYDDQAVNEEFLNSQFKSGFGPSNDERNKLHAQQARRRYIEFLADHGLVNPSYLSQQVICDIIKFDQGSNTNNFHGIACSAPAKSGFQDADQDDQAEPPPAPADSR